jgi:FkbM family methyltransferase
VSFLVRSRIHNSPRIVPLGRGGQIFADLTFNAGLRVAYANPPDMAEMTAWRRHLRPGDLFLDVGANVGVYTIWAAQLGAEVIALEPGRAAFHRLRQNLALNSMDVECRQVAVGAEPGRLELTDGKDTLNRLVLPGTEEAGKTVTVDVVTLDDVLGERTATGVKVDVEGAEELVVRGAARALSEGRIQLMQLEWNQTSEKMLGHDRRPVWELLQNWGYDFVRPDVHGTFHPVTDWSFGPDLFAVLRQ